MFKNPIRTKSWANLLDHFKLIKNIKMIDLFKKNKNRFKDFSLNFNNNILFDYSKNRIIDKTIDLFIDLLNEINFKDYVVSMLNGEKINFTENKFVLNFLLRDINNIFVKNNSSFFDIKKDIDTNLNKIKFFVDKINNYSWLGFSKKKIKNIVNIGIGGSDLGSRMIIKSLSLYKYNKFQKNFFVSNIDSTDIINILNKISPEDTIFIICSKSFTTLETLFNANIAKKWVLDFFGNKKDCLNNHFILVSSNFSEAIKFGVNSNNIFIVDDWVGGRYSFCSAFGLPIAISIGFDNFRKMLHGANDMDIHFFNSDYKFNIPIILSILTIWYSNFFNFSNEAILVYNENLSLLPLYLQQLFMESNGKYVDYNGNYINNYYTSPIIFGGTGTVSQHSFYQLLHQGTYIIPCDFFIEVNNNSNNINNSNLKLASNLLSQSQSLAFGDRVFKNRKDNVFLNNSNLFRFVKFKGNRPNNVFLIKKIDPYSIGAIISMYEHKVFTHGVILNISSFDQWGVELGKKLFNYIYPCLKYKNYIQKKIYFDSSTYNLIKYFNKNS